MAFKALNWEPKSNGRMAEGTARLNSHGWLHVRSDDLEKFMAADKTTVLLDADLQRIALRRPRGGDANVPFPVSRFRAGKPGKKQKPVVSMRIALCQVLKALGVDPKRAAGEYDLLTKEDLLILDLRQPGKK